MREKNVVKTELKILTALSSIILCTYIMGVKIYLPHISGVRIEWYYGQPNVSAHFNRWPLPVVFAYDVSSLEVKRTLPSGVSPSCGGFALSQFTGAVVFCNFTDGLDRFWCNHDDSAAGGWLITWDTYFFSALASANSDRVFMREHHADVRILMSVSALRCLLPVSFLRHFL